MTYLFVARLRKIDGRLLVTYLELCVRLLVLEVLHTRRSDVVFGCSLNEVMVLAGLIVFLLLVCCDGLLHVSSLRRYVPYHCQ